MAENGDGKLAGRVAFTYPAFRLYEVARFFTVVSMEMLSVAVGWQIYEITHRALDLGYVGLAQFLPGFLLFLVSGHAADRFDRRKLLVVCYVGFAICAGLLLLVSLRHYRSVGPIYGVLVLMGVVRSLNGPVSRALLPQLVAEQHFQNAVAWHSTIFQVGTILGPSLGGLIYAFFRGTSAVYAMSFASYMLAIFCTTLIKLKAKARARDDQAENGACGNRLHLETEGGVGIHLAGFVCDAAGRSGGATAGVCERYSAHGTVGIGIIAQCAGSGSGGDGDPARLPAVERAGGRDDALVRDGVRRVYDCVWAFAEPDCVVDCIGVGGCGGHGERGDSCDASAGGDAG